MQAILTLATDSVSVYDFDFDFEFDFAFEFEFDFELDFWGNPPRTQTYIKDNDSEIIYSYAGPTH